MDARERRMGTAFACERCRKHKVRCVPSGVGGACQRCQKARAECIEHIPLRRLARLKSDVHSSNRTQNRDKKLDKLTAIVATVAPPVSSPAHSALPRFHTVPSDHTDSSQQMPGPLAGQPASSSSISGHPLPRTMSFSSGTPLPFWEHMDIARSGVGRLDPMVRSISVEHMQTSLDRYQNMVGYFPFVPLPKDCAFQNLVQHRPMLMFAVLTVTSHDASFPQLMLSREFRKTVLVKIMHGDRSLDLLQGMLIFLAWHHCYTEAQTTSIFMLLQLCIGMAGDLGLDCMSRPMRSLSVKEESERRERMRAHLGCFYLASHLAMIEVGRTRLMASSTIFRDHALELASVGESRSDVVIPSLIDLCQLIEDVEETFRHHSELALVTRTQVKRLSDKLDRMQASSKHQIGHFNTLHWSHLVARVFLYQTALRRNEVIDRDTAPWASGYQLSLRVLYLRSIEQCLDNYVHLTSAQYGSLSLVDWLHLVCTTISLSKLASYSSSVPGRDSGELQVAMSFDYFRDRIASQMPRAQEGQGSNDDVFERFRRVTASMKVAAHNAMHQESPNSSSFELATSHGRTVSLLQEAPMLKSPGTINALKNHPRYYCHQQDRPAFDSTYTALHWQFLMGTI